MFEIMRRYIRGYKKQTILSPLFMFLEVGTDVSIPFIMKEIVDKGIPSGDINYVIRMGILMVLMAAFGMLFGIASSFFGAEAGYGIGTNVRDDLFKKIQKLSFNQINNFTVGSLITRVTADCATISQVAMMSLRMAIRSPIMLISSAIAAFSIDTKLATIFIVFMPILAFAVYLILSNVRKKFLEMQRRVDDVNFIVNEDLTSIRVIKSFVREDFEKTRFNEKNESLRGTSLQAMNIMILMIPVMFVIVYIAMITILWLGGNGVVQGKMEVGSIVALTQYCTMIYSSLIMVSQYFMQLARGNTAASRVKEVLNTKPELVNPEDGGIMTVKDGSVEFQDVNFRYEGNKGDSLNNINLKINSGETVGIIGSTGSAKSTLVQLIPRLYDSTNGEVKVGGVDVRKYNLGVLRDEVVFVLQDSILFSGTIRSNMQWGNEKASDEEIITALKNAQAWEFVSQLAEQLDARVEQGGANFSGGQKQRLCIARALLKDPKVLILDDSTSAVDMATDAKLRIAFRKNLNHITVFNIAQRISSIQDSDKIIVMDAGTINAIGTHDELMASNQIYQELYETQVKGGLAE